MAKPDRRMTFRLTDAEAAVIANIQQAQPHLTKSDVVHLLSIPATVLTMVHAYQAGSDSLEGYFVKGLALMVGIAVYPISIRLIGLAQRHRALAA